MKKILFIFFVIINFLNAQPKPYVIMVSIDAFRWDYLNRGITPVLEKIKKEGVSASSFQPSYPSKTFPNHVSIITGMYPENHGIISNNFNDMNTDERYALGDTVSVRESKWYLGEPFWVTAKRNGIISASYFWPGSEVHLDYMRPDYYYKYNRLTTDEEKIDGAVEWLNLPYGKRPHFITLYYEQVDTKSHDFGPDSKETNETIKQIDNVIGLLKEKISRTNLKDSIDLIVLSDHGMTSISKERRINIEKIIDDSSCKIINTGPIGLFQPAKGKIEEVYKKLKKHEKHYKVYYKNEMPGNFHYSSHPFIPEIIAVADLGWELTDNRGEKKAERYAVKLGDHGYDNFQLDMHGIFIAEGPSFKKNYATGTILNIDVYPLLCKIFGISPRSNIDGKLERIEFLLK